MWLPMSDKWRRLTQELLDAFPKHLPKCVATENWGDYDDANRAFAGLQEGSIDCDFLFRQRSVLGFINDDALRFLLPRVIACVVSKSSFDPDLFDAALSSLDRNRNRYGEMFSSHQQEAMIKTVRYLFSVVQGMDGISERSRDAMTRVQNALEEARKKKPKNQKNQKDRVRRPKPEEGRE